MTIAQTKNLIGNRTKCAFFKFLLLALVCIHFPALAEKSIALAWDASEDDSVTGYNVHYGTVSGEYTDVISVGNITTVTVSGLVEGVTYFFVVTAFNESGLESEPSNEILYSVPATVALQMQNIQLNGVQALAITATGTAPAQWTLESSEDLETWISYTNGTGPIDIQIPVAGEPNRFFRLKN